MRDVTIDNVTDVVIASLGDKAPIGDRQREIMTSLIKHLHGFCKDVNLTHGEFLYACDYLARAGRICDDKRQEFRVNPLHDWTSHYADAFRYYAVGHRQKLPERKINYSSRGVV